MTTGNLRAANFISAKIEWPTWLLLVIVYSAWISLTFYWDSIPGWLLWLIGGYTIALHSSLQHEALHGHPTTSKRINIALVWPPLTLWLPVELYVKNHLRHHQADLTDPEHDPEYTIPSRFLLPVINGRSSPAGSSGYWFSTTRFSVACCSDPGSRLAASTARSSPDCLAVTVSTWESCYATSSAWPWFCTGLSRFARCRSGSTCWPLPGPAPA
jgi:hypothetical protein